MTTILLIIISAFFLASANSVRVSYRKSIFNKWFPSKRKFFDESISWKNKFKKGDRNKGDKFLLSSTFLSFLTDFYNLAKFIAIVSLITSIFFYKPMYGILDIIIIYLIFSISYELFRKIIVSK
jgi:hypothetical protein